MTPPPTKIIINWRHALAWRKTCRMSQHSLTTKQKCRKIILQNQMLSINSMRARSPELCNPTCSSNPTSLKPLVKTEPMRETILHHPLNLNKNFFLVTLLNSFVSFHFAMRFTTEDKKWSIVSQSKLIENKKQQEPFRCQNIRWKKYRLTHTHTQWQMSIHCNANHQHWTSPSTLNLTKEYCVWPSYDC